MAVAEAEGERGEEDTRGKETEGQGTKDKEIIK